MGSNPESKLEEKAEDCPQLDVRGFLNLYSKYGAVEEYLVRHKPADSAKMIPVLDEFLDLKNYYIAASEAISNLKYHLKLAFKILESGVGKVDESVLSQLANYELSTPDSVHRWISEEVTVYTCKINRNSKEPDKEGGDRWFERKLDRINYTIPELFDEKNIFKYKISLKMLYEAVSEVQRQMFEKGEYESGSRFVTQIEKLRKFAEGKEKIDYDYSEHIRDRYKKIHDLKDKSPKSEVKKPEKTGWFKRKKLPELKQPKKDSPELDDPMGEKSGIARTGPELD